MKCRIGSDAVADNRTKQSENKVVRPQNRHLKPCKPGETHNPNGRPKGESLTTKIRRVLDEPDRKHGTKADALIAEAVKRARRGDFRFFKELIDRRDGKVPDRLAGADGEKLTVEVVFTENKPASAHNPLASRQTASGPAASN
jgi:hypothetical protein